MTAYNSFITHEKIEKVDSYIKDHWDESVHDDIKNPPMEHVLPIPVPHTVPCLHGHFHIFFYWDSYFTSLGLLAHKRLDIAKNNCLAMAYLVDRYGFIPNDSFRSDDNRSQPPYFALMVYDYYKASGDKAFFEQMLPSIKREYQFWMNARWTPIALNRHGEHATKDFLIKFYDGLLHRRLNLSLEISEKEKIAVSSNYLAEAETGWDFNPRFEHRCKDFCPVDLNSNLWAYEKIIAEGLKSIDPIEQKRFEELAERRASLMRKHLWNAEKGVFIDFDHANMITGKVASLAAFHPLWLGLATQAEAEQTRKLLDKVEFDWGVAVCEMTDSQISHQWGHPNGWPPLTYTTAMGLDRYGFHEDARRIAEKYVAWTIRHFERTGQLWEKLDVTTGEIAGGEYEAQPMLGWSAGVFTALRTHFEID